MLPTSGITGSMADTVGVKNPYRYRGYRYDSETELYYLQSRYYNPSWGRFINADAIGGVIGELLSHNIFAYCVNNVVNGQDPSGFRPIFTAGEETEEMRRAGEYILIPGSKLGKTIGLGLNLFGIADTGVSIYNNFKNSKSKSEAIGKSIVDGGIFIMSSAAGFVATPAVAFWLKCSRGCNQKLLLG